MTCQMTSIRKQNKENKGQKEIPRRRKPVSAVARSSRPSCCKQSTRGQGRQKLDNQRMEAVPP
ncbi:hypothetical protein SERLA73DRAFT_181961 [Serpula lacrymans var. lacrymans S7.3]|uniref:Uncharacterized protein n=1 Tax=Serpula lacrymans var. lacrymans (strain S7.3) TaxID=936435 RepID=F8PZ27_SERL3|nr:hypothetical protein SERLA73DRAFT_181961 [Serpula lacrymans var. lacrymans S7.3]